MRGCPGGAGWRRVSNRTGEDSGRTGWDGNDGAGNRGADRQCVRQRARRGLSAPDRACFMISIKKFLTSNDRDSKDANGRMAHLLLQAIGMHAVEGEQADYNAFRATIADLEASLAQEPSESNLLVT